MRMRIIELTNVLEISLTDKYEYERNSIKKVEEAKKEYQNFDYENGDPNIKKKLVLFEYLCQQYYSWNEEALKKWNDNNPKDRVAKSELSKVKLFKLLYFTAAAKASMDSKDSGLLDTFSNFRAYPKGAVEEDIYLRMDGYFSKTGKAFRFTNSNCLERAEGIDAEEAKQRIEEKLEDAEISDSDIRATDRSFDLLKKFNPFLVLLPNDAIVDLNHDCLSWLIPYSVGIKSKSAEFQPIDPNGYVNSEPKYYLSDSYTRRLWAKYR